VLVWWLRPLASALSLQWLFQSSVHAGELSIFRARLQAYCVARMVWIADLVYRYQVDHDPEDRWGFFSSDERVSYSVLHQTHHMF
jgi:hypothetical protein